MRAGRHPPVSRLNGRCLDLAGIVSGRIGSHGAEEEMPGKCRVWIKMSFSTSDRRKRPLNEHILGLFRVPHANGTYDSRGSCCGTRSAGGGRRCLPGHRNVAGPPTFPAPWTLRASQREADARPSNRRRYTDCGLRIGHGRVLPELDTGAAAGGAVHSRSKLRPRRTRLERSCARAAHGSADRAGATHAAGCHGFARAIPFCMTKYPFGGQWAASSEVSRGTRVRWSRVPTQMDKRIQWDKTMAGDARHAEGPSARWKRNGDGRVAPKGRTRYFLVTD